MRIQRAGRSGLATRWVAMLVVLLAAACAGEDAAAGVPPAGLEADWSLEGGDGPDGPIPVVDAHRPTLTIEGERWRGQVCNIYDTTVAIAGPQVSFDPVSRTEMACLNGGIMESEAAYLDAFDRVTAFEVDGDELRLRGDGVALRYSRVEPVPDAPLVGTTWRLESLVDGDGPDAGVSQATQPAELHFRDDGSLTGSTACRDLAGPYHLDGPLLDLTEVRIDEGACDDPMLVGQDEHVESTLLSGTAIRLAITGERLELTAPTGPGLIYRGE